MKEPVPPTRYAVDYLPHIVGAYKEAYSKLQLRLERGEIDHSQFESGKQAISRLYDEYAKLFSTSVAFQPHDYRRAWIESGKYYGEISVPSWGLGWDEGGVKTTSSIEEESNFKNKLNLAYQVMFRNAKAYVEEYGMTEGLTNTIIEKGASISYFDLQWLHGKEWRDLRDDMAETYLLSRGVHPDPTTHKIDFQEVEKHFVAFQNRLSSAEISNDFKMQMASYIDWFSDRVNRNSRDKTLDHYYQKRLLAVSGENLL